MNEGSKTPLLAVRDLSVRYGKAQVLFRVSIAVGAGELVALIGANGAGKTTLLRAISGVVPAFEGTVEFAGRPIGNGKPSLRVRLGISQVPEGRQVFPTLDVQDNLLLGGFTRTSSERKERLALVFEVFPVLAERRTTPAGALSGGQQQMLAIGRALMAQPRLLLMDEPSMGLSPLMVEEVFGAIVKLRRENVTVLLVEQNAELALAISDRGYVMETGRAVLEGQSAALLSNADVRRAYLGMHAGA